MRRCLCALLAVLLLIACGCSPGPEGTASTPAAYTPTYCETDKSYYSDGTLASSLEFTYDLDGNIRKHSWENYFEDGSMERFGFYRYDSAGNLLESEEECYYENQALCFRSWRSYDSTRDVMTVKEEFYSPDGLPQQITDGIYDRDCAKLLEGKAEEYYENGALSYCHNVTGEIDSEIFYSETGQVTHKEETVFTYDAAGRITQKMASGYDSDYGKTWTQDTVYKYNDAGNLVREHQRYGENGQRIEELLYTYEYDADGKVITKTERCILRGELLYDTHIRYEYNKDGLPAKEITVTRSGGETFSNEYIFEYDENGNLKESSGHND